ncbi:MAG: glucokinase [Pseudomonadota bacterium]|nr:glucokinase [Pseudomonadota bacterium]
MILTGDVGGTKTVLALYDPGKGVAGGAVRRARFRSGGYDSLEAMVGEFLRQTGATPKIASFGVAGPVREGRARITNLPWSVNADSLRDAFGMREVLLLNDLEALAVAVPHLAPEEVATLNPGRPEKNGNMVVVAPGTGLGVAFMVWANGRYRARPSEGGHASFAPRTSHQVELLQYLQRRHGHVSFERVCSGAHLPDLLDFLRERGIREEPEWLRRELSRAEDRTPVIVQAALERKAEIYEEALDLFVQALGTLIGDLAVTLLPRGGIYLGGGIPLRILERLRRPDFLDSIKDKGRFSGLCGKMPLHVIMNPEAALQGAARYALE